MDERAGRAYYASRRSEILALFDLHAQAWRPLLVDRYGESLADAVIREAGVQQQSLIPAIPYIGGDENPMTRHLIRSTTSLVLYKAMKARGMTAEETGRVIYHAVAESICHLPPTSPPTAEELDRKKPRNKCCL